MDVINCIAVMARILYWLKCMSGVLGKDKKGKDLMEIKAT